MHCLRGAVSNLNAVLWQLHRIIYAGRLSLVHARKSLVGAQLQPAARRSRLESLPLQSNRSAAAP